MPTGNIVTVIALLVASAIVGAAQTTIQKVPPKAVSPADGKAMFMEYCAVCHGTEGKGNGPAAAALKKAPADLTQLAAHASDGKFPAVHVSRFIGGDDAVQAHGTRDMPIWGDVFKSMNDRTTATQRVSNLTDYVKSIQAK
ncbi:MAG: c-type cytochrome [Bryobacteraceae bacterium]|jgi:mono/diheme cytochrome c family protein